MRLGFLICAICALAPSFAHAQWLSKVIPIPDTLYGLENPQQLTYDSSLGKIYVTGGMVDRTDAVVIDVESRRKTGVIRLPNVVGSPCLNTQADRLFCPIWPNSQICVVNCSTDAVVETWNTPTSCREIEYCSFHDRMYANGFCDSVAVLDSKTGARQRTFPLQGWLISLLYCADLDRLYCAVYVSDTNFQIAAVDCGTDSVIGTIPVNSWRNELVYDPVTQRLFCSGQSDVAVVDCVENELVGYVPTESREHSLAVTPELGKVFCANCDSNCILVIDAASASVVDTIFAGTYPYGLMYSPVLRRLFTLSHTKDSVYSIEQVAGSVALAARTGNQPQAVCAVEAGRDVYVANSADGTVTVLDGRTLAVRSVLTVDKFWPYGVCVDSMLNRAFCISDGGGDALVTVVDCGNDSIIMNTFVRGRGVSIGCWPDGDRVYCCTMDPNYVTILQASTGDEIAALNVGYGYPGKPVHAWNDCKVYIATSGWLTAVDCAADSVTASFRLGGQLSAASYNAADHRLYIADESGNRLYVLDCGTDSVVDTVMGLAGPCALCYEPKASKLYCANGQISTISVIDCHGDTVAGTIRNRPHPIAFSLNEKSGRLYCANMGVYPAYDTTVSVIDVGADTVIHVIGVGTEPGLAMCYTPAGNKVLVSTGHWGANSVSVIDCGDDRVVCRLVVPGSFWEFAVLTGLGKVYVPGDISSTLSVISGLAALDVTEEPGLFDREAREASMFRGVLFLPEAAGHKPHAASLMDVSGRKLIDLRPGANDVRALAPGVYFVREAQAQAQAQAVRKIVVTR